MALSKDIELENGIVTKYHRIVSINQIVNEQTIIEVASYINADKREEEKNALKTARETGQYPETNIFIHTEYVNKEYAEDDDIENAYKYIKTLDMFKKAKDI